MYKAKQEIIIIK